MEMFQDRWRGWAKKERKEVGGWFLLPLSMRNSKRPPHSKKVTIVLFFFL